MLSIRQSSKQPFSTQLPPSPTLAPAPGRLSLESSDWASSDSLDPLSIERPPIAACPRRISRYLLPVADIPVDFFADPDGAWEFDSLVEAAGFDPNNPRVCVGALASPFAGHPEGAAVVTELDRRRSFVAIVEYPADVPPLQASSDALTAKPSLPQASPPQASLHAADTHERRVAAA